MSLALAVLAVVARKAYFRKTRSAQKHKAFVKKQTAQLKALQLIVKRCN